MWWFIIGVLVWFTVFSCATVECRKTCPPRLDGHCEEQCRNKGDW